MTRRLIALVAAGLVASSPALAIPPTYQTSNGPQEAKGVVILDANGNQITSFGGSGGSGGAVTQGTSPWVDNVTQLGGVNVSLGSGASDTGTQRVVLGATEPALAVTGTFYQATQPVSAAALPLPAGAATSANQASQITAEQATQAAVQGTLKTQQQTGGATIETAVSSVPAGTSTTVYAASTGTRYRADITNVSSTSGNVLWCRTDGGTAVVGTGQPIYPNGSNFEWLFPTVGPAAINCIATNAVATIGGEAVQ